MKNTVLVVLTCVFLGCVPDDFVEDNRRNLIVGQVLNEEGSPLENITVRSAFDINNLIQEQFGFPSNLDPVLGESSTNSNGDFSFTSLVSRNNSRVNYVSIGGDENSNLQRVIYVLDNPFSGLIELPTTVLVPNAQLELNIERTSTAPTILFYTLEYADSQDVIFLSEGSLNISLNDSGELDVAENEEIITVSTQLGSTATFTYRIFNDDELIEEGTETITIDQETQTFSFEF